MPQRFLLVLLVAAVAGSATAFLALTLNDRQNAPPIVIADAPSEADIVVWVGGAVATPGIYTLPSGSRVNDALTAAGGVMESADSNGINLAARLSDEERIDIPFVAAAVPLDQTETMPSFGIRTDAPEPTAPSDGKIDINTADGPELETLPGIGPAIAERIIAFRTEHGPFSRIEELAQVNGISAEMVDEMSDLITAGS